ncbi:SET domain-containing protein [Mycena kentingensis (nom. inval.)]|nr:SET domain-containing protein [Mycena kentingensis (nom. inval.)]
MRRGFLKDAKTKPTVRASTNPNSAQSPTYREQIIGHPLDLGGRLPLDKSPIVCTIPANARPGEPVAVCLIWPETKRLLLDTPGFLQSMETQTAGVQPAFRVAESPGKGIGLFATRPLKQGDLILQERPLLFTTLALPPPRRVVSASAVSVSLGNTAADDFERHMQTLVDEMRPENRAEFMGLANSHVDGSSGPVHGRIRTNGCGVSGLRPGKWTGLEGRYSSLPANITRMNHSCSPNTQSRFDKASFSHWLFAARDIAEGEELTNNYATLLASAQRRKAELSSYSFTCTCPACLDAPTSDPRRARLQVLTPNPAQWIVDWNLPKDLIIQQCTEQIALIEKDGLQASNSFYMATSMLLVAYIALGDAPRASLWAARLLKLPWMAHVEAQRSKLAQLLDPKKTAAFERCLLWRARVDRRRCFEVFNEHARVVRAFGEFIDPFLLPLQEE